MKNIKTVCVSGGFDPIHIGHVRYIQEAAKLGDYLIVILNSDEFLVKKKGKAFMPFEERKEILFAIDGVDEVFMAIDKDMTVCETLELLKPDIFAKGGDRTLENIPEKETCERLGIDMVFGVGGDKIQSSSWIIEKYEKGK
jgi:D-beta-D-heptose 7-phosphate kinase/D-beta-D-heptose 1-phosphate adenosyltransferase